MSVEGKATIKWYRVFYHSTKTENLLNALLKNFNKINKLLNTQLVDECSTPASILTGAFVSDK
jgi:hypothetical protein